MNRIPLPTVKRLPAYLQILRAEHALNHEWTSTTTLADALRLKAIQVRKDMGSAECIGKPKKGFNTEESIEKIENLLGLKNDCEAVLIGVGSLGSALLKYGGFKLYDMKITAAFDTSPFLIGTKVGGVMVHDTEKLEKFIRRTAIRFAILAVPKEAAQATADRLIEAGIHGIWNFSPTYLKTPESVTVRREDLALNLVQLKAEVMFKEQL